MHVLHVERITVKSHHHWTGILEVWNLIYTIWQAITHHNNVEQVLFFSHVVHACDPRGVVYCKQLL